MDMFAQSPLHFWLTWMFLWSQAAMRPAGFWHYGQRKVPSLGACPHTCYDNLSCTNQQERVWLVDEMFLVRIYSEAKLPDWYSSWVVSVSSHTFRSSNKIGPRPTCHISLTPVARFYSECDDLTTPPVNFKAFLDIISCNLVDGYQRFGGTCCLYFQSRRLFHLEDGDSRFPSTKLHGFASQKNVILILTAMWDSNVTQPFYPSTHESIHLSIHSSTHPSIHPSIDPPIHPLIHPTVFQPVGAELSRVTGAPTFPAPLTLKLRVGSSVSEGADPPQCSIPHFPQPAGHPCCSLYDLQYESLPDDLDECPLTS
jgi:hypothetical protein